MSYLTVPEKQPDYRRMRDHTEFLTTLQEHHSQHQHQHQHQHPSGSGSTSGSGSSGASPMEPFWSSLRIAADESFDVHDESGLAPGPESESEPGSASDSAAMGGGSSSSSSGGGGGGGSASTLVLPSLEVDLAAAGYVGGLRDFVAAGQRHGDDRLLSHEQKRQQQQQQQQQLRGARTYVVGEEELRRAQVLQQQK